MRCTKHPIVGDVGCTLFYCILFLLVATLIGTSDAFAPSPRSRKDALLNAAGSSEEVAIVAVVVDETDPTGGCGEGFYKVKGEHGDVCVFDYEAAAESFGTGEEVVEDGYWEELESQNRARKKFGMDPLTPEQFVALQAQVREMETELKQKARERVAEKAAAEEQSRGDAPGFLQSFMNSVFQDTCESNFDCERPQVCCDFGFKKMCCSSGETGRDLRGEYAHVPIPNK